MPTVSHAFISPIAEDPQDANNGIVGPTEWNANHALSYNIQTSTTGSSVVMGANEDIREVNVNASFSVAFSPSAILGKFYTVVDTSGNASSNPITLTTIGYVIGSNGGAWTGYKNQSGNWVQVA